MKKLIFTIILSSVISSVSFAREQADIVKLSLESIKEAELFDGRTLNFKKEVHNAKFYYNEIDYLELSNGEIVDRTDIQSIRLFDNHSMVSRVIGVDGGG